MDHLLRPLLKMVCGSSVTNSIRPFFAASFKYYVIVKNFRKVDFSSSSQITSHAILNVK